MCIRDRLNPDSISLLVLVLHFGLCLLSIKHATRLLAIVIGILTYTFSMFACDTPPKIDIMLYSLDCYTVMFIRAIIQSETVWRRISILLHKATLYDKPQPMKYISAQHHT